MDTPTGIPQGSPLSPILYLFYNADLIEELSNGGQTMGWIDDVGLLVEGDSAETNCQRIESMLETAYQWADQHASVCTREICYHPFLQGQETRPDSQATHLRHHC